LSSGRLSLAIVTIAVSAPAKPLITWLKQSDCESVYCREVEEKDVEGPTAVPEFRQAMVAGEKEYGNRELAQSGSL